MKKIIGIIAVCIGMSSGMFAQDIDMTSAELSLVLCKQWDIEYAMMGSMKIGQAPGAKDFDLKFNADGSCDMISDTKTERGTWEYDASNDWVDISVNGTNTSRVRSVSSEKLVLKLVKGGNDPQGLPSVEIHFKPKK